MTITRIDAARGLFAVLETSDVDHAVSVVAPDNVNLTASASPPACQLPGPAGTIASSAWLRHAFSELHFRFLGSAEDSDTVWVRLRMTGTHTGPFVRFENGIAAAVIPPTNRLVDVEQVHLVTVRDGLTTRHEALRDDLGMLGQLGVFPPGRAAMTMAAWKMTGRAARAADDVTAVAAAAAARVGSASGGEHTARRPRR